MSEEYPDSDLLKKANLERVYKTGSYHLLMDAYTLLRSLRSDNTRLRAELDSAKSEVEELTNDSQRICGENHDYALRVLKLESERDAARRDAERVTVTTDLRRGRCACEWTGDKLKVVCISHLDAVRKFDAAMKEQKP